MPGEWVQLAEIRLECADDARLGQVIPVVDEWLRKGERSPFITEKPKRAKILRLPYIEHGRDPRKLRKSVRAGVEKLRGVMRKQGFSDVIVRGPHWRSDYFQGDVRLEKYLPVIPSENLTGREHEALEPVFVQLNKSSGDV